MPLLLAALLGLGPCSDLPLRVGTEWTYRAKVVWAADGGARTARRTIIWHTTVLTVASSDTAVAATVRGWPSDLAWWQPGRTATISVLFCTAGRVYQLSAPSEAAGAVAESLLNGTRRPAPRDLALELPLRTGSLFGRDAGQRDDALYAWLVEKAEPMPASLRRLRAGATDSLYSVVFRTLPDHVIVGFVPGLGVAHYLYAHHGTAAEADAWLVAFREARP